MLRFIVEEWRYGDWIGRAMLLLTLVVMPTLVMMMLVMGHVEIKRCAGLGGKMVVTGYSHSFIPIQSGATTVMVPTHTEIRECRDEIGRRL